MEPVKVSTDSGRCWYAFEEEGYVHIFNLFVDPDERKKGNAKKLLQLAIYEIRKTGWKGEIQIVAKPTEANISVFELRNFYKKMGLQVYDQYL